MRGRGATFLRRQWCSIGLQLLCTFLFHPFWAAAMSWTCRIDFVAVENIPIPSTTTQEGGRRMLSQNDAMVLPANQTRSADPANEAVTSLFSSSEQDSFNGDESTEDIAYQEGRECICAILLPTNDKFYCPSPTDHCTVWIRKFHDDYTVSCFERKGWTVGFARNVWYYLSFLLLLLALYPIFTMPGRHAVRYVISKCFPRMNVWITNQLLQTEIDVRTRIQNEIDSEERQHRQTEGWISGYSLKTKRYLSSCEGVEDCIADNKEDSQQCDNVNAADSHKNNFDPESESNDEEAGLTPQDTTKQHDYCKRSNDEDEHMCTICLLELEDGEQIADLSCGHMYHADCLGEWILKKNACPLCQNPNIAKAIRSFEPSEDEENGNSNNSNPSSQSVLNRWRNNARESVIDVATGRSQGIGNNHRGIAWDQDE